jgi:hypothetical protein
MCKPSHNTTHTHTHTHTHARTHAHTQTHTHTHTHTAGSTAIKSPGVVMYSRNRLIYTKTSYKSEAYKYNITSADRPTHKQHCSRLRNANNSTTQTRAAGGVLLCATENGWLDEIMNINIHLVYATLQQTGWHHTNYTHSWKYNYWVVVYGVYTRFWPILSVRITAANWVTWHL